MSEPMTQVEIEDVLLSIRRLVSDDLRPIARPAPEQPEKLMLTPALRVVPAAEEAAAGQVVMAVGAAMHPAEDWEHELADGPDAVWAERGWAGDAVVEEAEVLGAADGAPGWAQDAPEEVVTERASEAAAAPVSAEWADQAEAEAVAALESDLPGGSEAEGQDDLLDEEILRDLVRDIIREELQGNLGERITRNVRKLVRAEISRALSARDFD